MLQLACATGLQFSVTYPKYVWSKRFSGRVVLFLTQGKDEPRFGPDWLKPEPMIMARFKNVGPDQAMVIDDNNAIGYPGKISTLPSGSYTVQAVVDLNLGGRSIGTDAGNLMSAPIKLNLDPARDQTIQFVCDKTVPPMRFRETATTKEIAMPSRLLTKWYGRPTKMFAGVVVPPEYAKQPKRKFPILYIVPGFGGTHQMAEGVAGRYLAHMTEPFIAVTLNADCPGGHSVFADSDNNGPWGKALTTELIPFIESKYRTYKKPGARFVTGHSSGGWSSLWLQVTYPQVFGGCWSTSPDPVDFREFQTINLYHVGQNFFTDSMGKPRPIARQGDDPIMFCKPFSDMERPLRGEQLYSFEAVFSRKGSDGEPLQMWNRETGAIDPAVVEQWKRYDISLNLRRNWKTLGPKLKGKLHIYTGDRDTFYLDVAVRQLKVDLKALGSDAYVEVWPGDHGSVMTPKLIKNLQDGWVAQFEEWQASQK